ncbi:sushi domain-containing protein 2-like, partial [Ruditapes philippinarum]|uniref:sushi domain-containing protein 2-like n=1 Tax=Ruditapes philippinarum TaxID=129788 RepID=UPI00295BDEE0
MTSFMNWKSDGNFDMSNHAITLADEDKLSCQGFAADIVIRDLISSGHATAEPCPCIEQIIAIDETFEKVNNCYNQWFFTDGIKQMCCYSENGQLLIDGPGAGYLLLESNEGYIERAHDMCCGNGSDAFKESCESFYQINKPDDCSTYVPPVVSMSSGDPVIQTIDGGKYDFNGHGEYVFLTDGKNFEIQARTEYVVKGNKDSTYFSAFALLDKTSDEQIELHYDREADDIRYFRNGSYNSNCNASSMLGHGRPYLCENHPQRPNCFVLAGGGKITIQNCGFKSYIKQLVFGTDNFLSIQIMRDSKANITNITGLAGHREDGFYIARNNSKVSENAPALSFFHFGESWSLRSESESVFMYKETGGNFTVYNKHHSRPEFLEDKLGNLTALFKDFRAENISLFNITCRNYWNNEPNNQCLLAIARTGNYNRGLDVMHE